MQQQGGNSWSVFYDPTCGGLELNWNGKNEMVWLGTKRPSFVASHPTLPLHSRTQREILYLQPKITTERPYFGIKRKLWAQTLLFDSTCFPITQVLATI